MAGINKPLLGTARGFTGCSYSHVCCGKAIVHPSNAETTFVQNTRAQNFSKTI